jgi:hypothetical protein
MGPFMLPLKMAGPNVIALLVQALMQAFMSVAEVCRRAG